MEWSALIGNGSVCVRVEFTGGSVTGYGVTPAEYTTGNPVIQALIEGSDYFRSGRIRLLRGTPGVTGGEVVRKRNKGVSATAVKGEACLPLHCAGEETEAEDINDARRILLTRGYGADALLDAKSIRKCARACGLVIRGE